MIQRKNQKAVTAVVATALIIVVAVVSVIGFQSWFGSFSSKTFVNVEQNSKQADSSSQIETLVGDELYFKNNLEENLSIKEIKVNGKVCNISISNLSLGIESINLQNCTDNLTTNVADIVIITEKKIFNKKVFLKDVEVKNTEIGAIDLPNCIPANNILHVGSGQTYAKLIDAYNAANNGDAIVLHTGSHDASEFKSTGGSYINKSINFFGATGDPNEVNITANVVDNWWFMIMLNQIPEANVSIGFYHMSFSRNQFNWMHYFTVYGKSNPENNTFKLENTKLITSLASMHPISIESSNPKIIYQDVDFIFRPYSIVCGQAAKNAAQIHTNSLYLPDVDTPYFLGDNFNMVLNNYSTNPATHGTSQYNRSNAVFPCGYTP